MSLPKSSSAFVSLAMPFHTATTWPWVATVVLLSFVIAIQRRRNYGRLPPGPTPLPIVGNILDFPRKHFGREFAALSAKFGVYLVIHDMRLS